MNDTNSHRSYQMAMSLQSHRSYIHGRWAVVLSFVLLSAQSVTAQSNPVPVSRVLVEGEELVYNVRYAIFDLGQVKITVREMSRDTGRTTFRSIATINSYKGVPFVDLAATYDSRMDSAVYSYSFVGRSKEGKVWDFARYGFEYDNKRVLIEKGRKDTIVERRDTVTIDRHMQDGLSLFFYARDQLFSKKRMNIPCFVAEQKVNTYIDFSRQERKSIDLDAVEYPVDVIGFDGTAEFVGIYGLTGDFEGWFSNDEARIPIVANMKVILGSVTLELVSWKRPGWSPPRGN